MRRLNDATQRNGGALEALRAGALATGCDFEHTWLEPPYADLRGNAPMCELYAGNSERLGRHVATPGEGDEVVGSTDMGNVSYAVPSIHPMIAVAPKGVSIHTPEFALHAAGPAGDAAVVDGAKAMAMTVADLWSSPGALAGAKAAFEGSRP